MKRREPTEDEVTLFEAVLKDAARLTPKNQSPRGRTSGNGKKPAARRQNANGQATSPVPRGAKRRNKQGPDILAPPLPQEPGEVDDARAGRALMADERALFEAALNDAVPLAVRSATAMRHAAMKGKAKARPATAGPAADAPGPTGLDGRRRAKLRRGSLEPEARLDLHGLTEVAAHHALTQFVHQAMARGLRLVLVVTGKGGSGPRDGAEDSNPFVRRRGVLRHLTPRWLKEPELAHFVAEMTPAHRRHGGQGALYVYLRKPR